MRFLKFYLLLVIFFLVILTLPNSVSAFPKYKVTLLPIINTANIENTEAMRLIEYKIHRKLRFPFYEFIPDTEIASAISVAATSNTLRFSEQSNLSLIAKPLSADIMLAAEIVKARSDLQHSFFLWNNNDETIENIHVLLIIYAYSVQDNKFYVMKAEKCTTVPLNANSGLLSAIDEVMDELLKKLPFTTIPSSTFLEEKS